jgi:hypothetical protein
MSPSRAWHRVLPLLAAVTLAASLSTAAHAQLGGLRRAVERRVEKKAEEKVEDRIVAATLIPPTFDSRTVEITAERLDRYTAAMERRKVALAANRQRYDAMQGEISALTEAAQRADNPAERRSYEQADSRYRDCRRGVLRATEAEGEKQIQALTARMQANPVGMQNDPKVREMMASMQALGQAQQSGDSAAVARATERMQRAVLGAVDSATIDRKAASTCGARPVQPRSVILSDSLSMVVRVKGTEANALRTTAGGVRGSEVGLTDEQARAMWERIMSWLNGVSESAPITRTFTRAEYDLLLERRSALKKVFADAE